MIDIPSNLTDGDSVYLGDKRFVYNGGNLVPYVVTNGGGTGGVDSTKAPLNSPSLTGVPTAPTAAVATNNTQIATTAFVKSVVDTMIGDIASALDTINGQVI